MFNLAIDSKLRGCDVVALRVEDVAPSGYAVDRATVRQKKTGRPVRFPQLAKGFAHIQAVSRLRAFQFCSRLEISSELKQQYACSRA
jgi:hypothetical protein